MFVRYATLAVAAASIASAQPHKVHGHRHGHRHLHKRAPSPAADAVVPGPTLVVFALDGAIISKQEVEQGIANGTLEWADGAPSVQAWTPPASTKQPAPTKAIVTTPSVAPTTSSAPPPPPVTTSSVAPAVPAKPVVSAPAAAPVSSAAPAAPVVAASSSSGTGLNSAFPDGQLDCSTFPSAYGALNLDWYGLGGWIGIQIPGSTTDAGFDDIHTASSGPCPEGGFCSYACPAGYQKSQWPSTQGATAQSVGGLLCKGGKLWLTNSALSNNLCIQGTTAVKVMVQNNMGQQVAVCRTDYPGTEAETVPVGVAPGASEQLTTPDSSSYYTWQGKSTSAQYYVNPAGVSVQDGCKWGDGSTPTGNWAPLNIGTGYHNGVAYISMLPNAPTTTANLDYKVTLSGGDMGQTCTYENGQYTSSIGGTTTTGCTLSATSGTMTFTFST